jgi:hypothetical protein
VVQLSVPARVKPEGTSFSEPYNRWADHYRSVSGAELLRDRKVVRKAVTDQGRGYTVELVARYHAVVDELMYRKFHTHGNHPMWEKGEREYDIRGHRYAVANAPTGS